MTDGIPGLTPGLRVGLYGGSFNPAHGGHLAVAEAARRACRLQRVVWLVSPGSPLKSSADYRPLDRRMAEARRLVRGRPKMVVSDAESRLGTRFTADTVGRLTSRHPGVRFVWIMGADSLASFDRWRDWREIAARVPMLVVSRPGETLPALTGPAGRALAAARVPVAAASSLADRPPPAWIYLPAVHDPRSATAIRREEAAAT